MSAAEPFDRRVQLSVKLASRSVSPGDRTAGSVELRAGAPGRVEALRVVARCVRRERHQGEVRESSLPVCAAMNLGAYALSADAAREIPFTLHWPGELASSVPNQLDYDLVATAVLEGGAVEASVRVLVLPSQGGSHATLPVGPPWIATGTPCEAEDDDGRWRPGEVEGVNGLMVLVRWGDGAPSAWLPLRRLRERGGP